MLAQRAVAIELEVLKDPAVRQSVEQRNRLREYWVECGRVLAGSTTVFRENDPGRGRSHCRFQSLDTGISFAAQYYAEDGSLCVYFAVTNKATRRMRMAAKDLAENHLATLSIEIGSPLEWSDPYFTAYTNGRIDDRSDWPRQHQWVCETARKFAATFKTRLGLDE